MYNKSSKPEFSHQDQQKREKKGVDDIMFIHSNSRKHLKFKKKHTQKTFFEVWNSLNKYVDESLLQSSLKYSFSHFFGVKCIKSLICEMVCN